MIPAKLLIAIREAIRIGKARAGRLLDGRTWDEMPGERNG